MWEMSVYLIIIHHRLLVAERLLESRLPPVPDEEPDPGVAEEVLLGEPLGHLEII